MLLSQENIIWDSVLLTDKKVSPLEVLTAVREEISKKDYDPFYLTVLGPQFECARKYKQICTSQENMQKDKKAIICINMHFVYIPVSNYDQNMWFFTNR
jgi:hypothetical protein